MTNKSSVANLKEDYGTKYGFHDPEDYVFKAKRGLTRKTVEEISWMKKEPGWMTKIRLDAYAIFLSKPMPTWGNCDLINQINFDEIFYYLKPTDKTAKNWDDVPEKIKNTFEKLGIPQAERKFLAGVTAQYESEAVYHAVNKELEKSGVIFTDMDTALREYPDMVKKYFGTVIPGTSLCRNSALR